MKLTLKLPRQQPAPHNVEGLAYDCELAARIHDGERAAMERLVDRHLPRVNRYVHHRLGPGRDEVAWRIVQATFEDALGKLGPYARKATVTPMESWLIRLAERHIARQRPAKESEGSFRNRYLSPGEDDLTLVRAAMKQLPARHSSVLALSIFEGMSAEGIAYTLGVSQLSAMRRLRAALKQIGKKLDPADEDEG